MSQNVALAYLRAGLCVLPARLNPKMPALPGWKPYQERLPKESAVCAWFAEERPMCLLTGAVSGNLEMIDFDGCGEKYPAWLELVRSENPGLMERLVIEKSPSGGCHVVYRSAAPVCGNKKLAERTVVTPDEKPVEFYGKSYVPRKVGDHYEVTLTLIETRGQGGLFLCHPSPGYDLLSGDYEHLPVLTEAERELFLEAAWSLNEAPPKEAPIIPAGEVNGRPGDDYNERGDVREVLQKHGWTRVRGGDNEYWRRPGKGQGWSATLKNGVFYVFSSNAAPFEPQRAYGPFAVYAHLEHGGDFSAAASALRRDGYGQEVGAGADLQGVVGRQAQSSEQVAADPKSLRQLVRVYPSLRAPVIHGLLRQGETMNVISASKIGKSWLVTDLALAVASGRPWLGTFEVEAGDVLILDNELHGETSAHRIPKVAEAKGIAFEEVADHVFVENLRGRLQDICSLGKYFQALEPGRFKIIILDAFYRFMPTKTDENDNGTMANLYNLLDGYADRLKCSFVLIHHTSKGNQSLKEITDVGAGAGAQARATDTHLILRRHERDDVVVMEAAVRSWAPLTPRCLRWAFPVWLPADDLDPAMLKQEGGKRRSAPANDDKTEEEEKRWTPESFTEAFVTREPKIKAAILAEANERDLKDHKAENLLAKAQSKGLVFRWDMGRCRIGYATAPQPEETVPEDEPSQSKRRQVEQLLLSEPDLGTAEVAKRCGVSDRYVRNIRRCTDGEDHA